MINHTASREEHAEKAAAILHEDAPLQPAEQAAEKVIRESKWILWHAGDRDLGVIRLLHRAGLLRDVEREMEQEKAHASMRRLDKADHAANRVLAGMLAGLVDEVIRALRDGRDPVQLADQIEAVSQRATERADRTRRGDAEESTEEVAFDVAAGFRIGSSLAQGGFRLIAGNPVDTTPLKDPS